MSLELPDETSGSPFDASPSSSRIFKPKSTFAEESRFAKPPRAAQRHEAGDQVGVFRLIEPLGQGAMGQVWLAQEQSGKRRVALKLIQPDRLGPRSIEWFDREARAQAKVVHPGVVAMHMHGQVEGLHFIAQELVGNGWTLADSLSQYSSLDVLPEEYFQEAALLVRTIADAMQAAHEAGVIHRDLKPSNILIADSGHPKVTDFGLARVTGDQTLSDRLSLAGTYMYMSPEQATAKSIGLDHRTDIFSLGVILYEILTLQRPFVGDTVVQIQEQIIWKDPPTPRALRSRVPEALSTICMKALEKRRVHRYESMRELSEELHRFLRKEPVKVKPPGPLRITEKWVRRHPTLAVGLAAGLTALLVISALLFNVSRLNVDLSREKNQAEQNLRDRKRLSDLKTLQDLEKRARHLWPARAALTDSLKEWIAQAEELVSRQEVHETHLQRLREQALPVDEQSAEYQGAVNWQLLSSGKAEAVSNLEARIAESEQEIQGQEALEARDEVLLDKLGQQLEEDRIARDKILQQARDAVRWRFGDSDTQWWHDTLAQLVEGLQRLGKRDLTTGSLASVRHRLGRARTIHSQTVENHIEEWEEAIYDVANSDLYGQLELEPQAGLIPLGPDLESGLWEFIHTETGTHPERDPATEEFIMTPNSGIVLVLLPAMGFVMGAQKENTEKPNYDPYSPEVELHLHEVQLSPFLISKYEMTQGQWQRVAGNKPSYYGESDPRVGEAAPLHPVENVNWDQCRETLQRVGLELPTEAQWEYAARSKTSTTWNTGNAVMSLVESANTYGLEWAELNTSQPTDPYKDGYFTHAPVGSKEPNLFGLHDVHGNLFEWCLDGLLPYEFPARPGDGLRLPRKSWIEPVKRVVRGGSFRSTAHFARSAARYERQRYGLFHECGTRPVWNIATPGDSRSLVE
jgi:serine/threonine protein kinase/formylglycine-generating enzyme required for sulfatase activity